MRHDVPDQWQELFYKSNQSLRNAAYQDAVIQSSLALDELTEKTVDTLNIRAIAFGKSANYDQGIRDASRMVELAPTSPKGYTCMAELYAMQGKQKLAIEIIEKGIEKIPQTGGDEDSVYQQLSIQRQIFLDQQNQRIDLITLLPFDILPKIMSYLPTYMRVICINVSHSWRSRIRQCSSIWRKMIIDHSDYDDARVYHNLSHVSDQVRELSLRGFIEHTPFEFLKSLKIGYFTNLRTLALRRSRITSANELFQGLEQIRGTLKNLILISIQNDPIHLDTVLSVCTNLSTFKYKGSQLLISRPSTLPISPQLISLELETGVIIRTAQLEPLIRCCPNIQNLYSLSFNLYTLMNDDTYTSNNNNSNINDMVPTTGLRKLNIHRVEAIGAVNLAPLLMKSSETLEELVLNMDDDVGPVQLWHPLTTFSLPKLRKLRCQVRPIMQHTLATIIRQCPQLQDVVFDYSEYIGNQIFDALAELSKLQRIEMNSVSEINDVGLVQFLEKHGALGEQSTLKVFETDGFSNITDEALTYLADVMTLEKLRLDGCSSVTAHGMEQFVERVKPDCALQTVMLCNMEAVTDTMIQGLCKLEHLCDVQLARLKNITDQSIADLVSTSLSLQSLWIYDCALVTKFMIKQARIILEGRY
ncbi:hypothetical protein INT45_012078 [Circinella minor]|uniref:F-box domain-containing protein n=1 Tax=Circinella minor TaxID=1195481 RepID=A0A8H7VUY9_9FUNG|nr:hypothetical protein INT45_012078 [Circinella minor]